MLQIRRKKSERPAVGSEQETDLAAEQQEGSDAIIAGITAEAQVQAAALIEQAERTAGQKLKSWELQKSRLRDEARAEAEAKAEELRRSGYSRLKIDQRKRRLQLHEQLVGELTQQALSDTQALIETDRYPAILQGLIAEAAIGIRTETAIVSSSAQELPLITDSLLEAVIAQVKDETGRAMNLTVSGSEPLPGQGVILTSEDGNVAFSNQIRTRLLRYQSEIRHLIYRRLLTGEGKEHS
jgi:vacuolar-type H+-ATPase subunit E/Vma4